MIKDENLVGKRPLERLRLRWEDVIIKYAEALNWKTRADDREGWRIECVTGWSIDGRQTQEEEEEEEELIV